MWTLKNDQFFKLLVYKDDKASLPGTEVINTNNAFV